MLFNTIIDNNGKPDFFEQFPHPDYQTGEIILNKNLRAIAPLDEKTFSMPIVPGGVIVNPTHVDFITLTRDEINPSAIAWESMADALTYYGGLVKVKTDAEISGPDSNQATTQEVELNFGCTAFDVADRGRYLGRLNSLFANMVEQGIEVSAYTLNTGAPEKEESMAIVSAIAMGNASWQENKDLGVSFATDIPGISRPLYFPQLNQQELIDAWKEMQTLRSEFFQAKNLDLAKANLGPTNALV
jgi:hypothetical protein